MKNLEGKNVLVTCSTWFVAPDGKDYKAVYGKLKKVHDAKESFGIQPSRAHASWILEVGHMMIMGCQALFVIECANPPNFSSSTTHTHNEAGVIKEQDRPCVIYNANE